MTYIPQIDDYVVWIKNGIEHKCWVYFVDDLYITIETGIKPKPNFEYTKNEKHKYIHTLLLCHPQYWKDLEYVHTRKNKYGNTIEEMDVYQREINDTSR